MGAAIAVVGADVGSFAGSVREDFYTAYIKAQPNGFFLEGNARRVMYPLLSKRLRTVLDDAAACQKDWVRQQPKGSTDKPPFVDGCLFASIPEGMPTSFTLGPTKALPDGSYEVAVDFVRKETTDLIKWRDAVIVITEGNRFAVDEFIGGVDDGPSNSYRLSTLFKDCRNRRWIGGP